MKRVGNFKRTILKLCREYGFDIKREGQLTIGQAEYDENGGGTMPLFIQRTNKSFIRVAHYYKQNGDVMSDPEVWVYVDTQGNWYPQNYRIDSLGIDFEYIKGDWEGGTWIPKTYSKFSQSNTASFCNGLWRGNIAGAYNKKSSVIKYYHETDESYDF